MPTLFVVVSIPLLFTFSLLSGLSFFICLPSSSLSKIFNFCAFSVYLFFLIPLVFLPFCFLYFFHLSPCNYKSSYIPCIFCHFSIYLLPYFQLYLFISLSYLLSFLRSFPSKTFCLKPLQTLMESFPENY